MPAVPAPPPHLDPLPTGERRPEPRLAPRLPPLPNGERLGEGASTFPRALHPELGEGRRAKDNNRLPPRVDREIKDLTDAATPAWCDSVIEAHSVTLNRIRRIPRGLCVMQMFNHQTHHRSQLTTGLYMMGLAYGTTDIPFRPGIGF